MTFSHVNLVASLFGLFSISLVAQSPSTQVAERESDVRLTAQVRASRNLGRGLDERHVLRVRHEEAGGLGETYTRTQQYFQGIRVLGGELVLRQRPEREAEAIADALVRDLNLQPVPSLEAQEALAIAHAMVAPKGPYLAPPKAELVVFPIKQLAPRPGVKNPKNAEDFEEVTLRHELAYLIHIELEQEDDTRHEDLLIQAHTGGILRQWSTLHTATHEGVGKSEYSGTVKLSTNSLGSAFELRDMARAGNFTTNMNGATSGNGSTYTWTVDQWGDGSNYVQGNGSTSINGQTAAVDAHYGMQVTWDFLSKVLGRNGIDGTGRTVFSRVHYGTSYDNAFWSDASFCMTFGDGSMFKTLTSLDVAAHEMGHGVCSTTANLAYVGESGGLNEANSDIFGTMVEFYANGAQAEGSVIPDTGGNWTMGEQLETASFPTPLRYMHKPSLDGRSPDAWSSSLASLDVHFSSGPMNRAFYFLSQGSSASASSQTYSAYLPVGMTGLGNDRAMRIWWRTLTTRLTSSSNYLAARNGAIASAKDLYGAGSVEEIAVWNAFAAINVGSAWKVTDTSAPTVSAKVAGTSGSLSFTATATDNLGVTKVEYYVNGALKGSATASPYTFAFLSTALTNGSYNLVAKAYDAAGNVGTSATVAFTVNNPDTTAPIVTAKIIGTTGTLTFTATATDNIGVTKVEYYVDGALKGSATASPYTFAFNSTTLANGSHSLVAKAYDAAGNIGTSVAVPFTVDTVAPTVTAKVTGTSGSLTFTATAMDNIGVTKVEYYVDGALKGSATASPYTLAFSSTALANGSHNLVAKAYDAAGNVGTSATVAFTISNDLTAPTVSAKVAGTSGTLIFTATATDNLGVTKVEYYVNGALKGGATASPYTFAFLSTALANGSYSLVAKAYDAAGNVGTSATVAFTINNPDTTAPIVTAKITGTAGTQTFTATATDNIGVTKVEYYVDGALKGSATASPYTFAFNSAAVTNGTHSLVAKAYDTAGNVGTSAAVAFIVDTTAPSVAPKITGTAGILTFTATATDNIGVTKVEYYVDGALKGNATASPHTLAFSSTALANGSHNLVAKAYDAAGNVGTSATVAFAISNDLAAPTVSAQVSGTSGTLTFTATATDNIGVTKVEYYVNGALKGSATASPYTFAFLSTALTNGSSSLVAKAYDAAGNVGISATVAFTVNNAAAGTSLQETENNDTIATANPVANTVTTVTGAISTGADVDTFAFTLVAGQSITLTLTPPPGMYYGMSAFQGLAPQSLLTPKRPASGQLVITIPAPAPSATQATIYLQIYSLNNQGSSAHYTLAVKR